MSFFLLILRYKTGVAYRRSRTMMTLKFDYADVTKEDHGCVKLLEGYNIWYQRREVKNEEEWDEYKSGVPGYRVIGTSIIDELERRTGEPAFFTHIQFFNDQDYLQNVIFCGGICYIMNEEGKTVDIIN
jgi:hypothetical protein